METRNLNSPVATLTIGEFLNLIDEYLEQKLPKEQVKEDNRHLVYGLSGLASLLGCSKKTASLLKSSGKIDDAITQNGRKIVVDADKALEILKEK